MELVVLYFGMAVIGYIVGSKCKKNGKNFNWTGKAQLVAIVILVFVMGSRIGSDEKVVSSLGSIGFIALTLTIFVMAGSVFAVYVARKLMKLNKEGMGTDD